MQNNGGVEKAYFTPMLYNGEAKEAYFTPMLYNDGVKTPSGD